ncbi:COX15/CtaA family protein [soil metagenome]
MASIASTGSIPLRDKGRDRAIVRGWLTLVALMIVAIVVVGGITRLTHAGLSITEWKPVHGVIPPLSDVEWQDEFLRYQQIPEFKLLNPDMTLAEFKGIFWWEWTHRLLARLIGVVVLVPLILLWVGGRIEPALKPRLVALFLLGGLQGAVGWWMVASGLSERTDVSQYRLATHLTLALAILAFVVWIIRSLSPTPLSGSRNRLRGVAGFIAGLTLLQIFLGGLVAGLDAGLTFNTWPLMDGTLVPSGLFIASPAWRNLFENVATVQFDHRLGAYVLFAMAAVHAGQARGTPFAGGAVRLFLLVTLQAALGVTTLLWMAPLPLALAHQLGAVVVLIAAVAHLRSMWPAMAAGSSPVSRRRIKRLSPAPPIPPAPASGLGSARQRRRRPCRGCRAGRGGPPAGASRCRRRKGACGWCR